MQRIGTSFQQNARIPFAPYKNEISSWSYDGKGWELENIKSLSNDMLHPIIPETRGSLKLVKVPGATETTAKRTFNGKPNTKYLFSVHIRNNGMLTTRVTVGDKKEIVNTTRVVRVSISNVTDEEGNLEISLISKNPNGNHDAWYGGFMIVEVDKDFLDKSDKQLAEIYEHVETEKVSPSARDILKKYYHFLSDRYYVLAEDEKLESIDTPLEEVGVNEGDVLTIGEEALDVQLSNAFINDVPLMAMLEGDYDHVSHAYPKENREMAKLAESNFPRLQFFTGFSVNSKISDTRAFADSIIFALNIYIPVTKVMESVTAQMILDRTNVIMADLGWAKVRGSDYFLKQEQLYILQSQYVKDVLIDRTTI